MPNGKRKVREDEGCDSDYSDGGAYIGEILTECLLEILQPLLLHSMRHYLLLVMFNGMQKEGDGPKVYAILDNDVGCPCRSCSKRYENSDALRYHVKKVAGLINKKDQNTHTWSRLIHLCKNLRSDSGLNEKELKKFKNICELEEISSPTWGNILRELIEKGYFELAKGISFNKAQLLKSLSNINDPVIRCYLDRWEQLPLCDLYDYAKFDNGPFVGWLVDDASGFKDTSFDVARLNKFGSDSTTTPACSLMSIFSPPKPSTDGTAEALILQSPSPDQGACSAECS